LTLNMRIIAAYLLAVLGGNENPTSSDIKKILGSVGIDAEDAQIEKVIHELHGKKLQDIIAEGSKKLASLPSGGAAAPAAAPAAPAAAEKKEEKGGKKEEKKEEKKKEEKKEEEEEGDLGFGLFA